MRRRRKKKKREEAKAADDAAREAEKKRMEEKTASCEECSKVAPEKCESCKKEFNILKRAAAASEEETRAARGREPRARATSRRLPQVHRVPEASGNRPRGVRELVFRSIPAAWRGRGLARPAAPATGARHIGQAAAPPPPRSTAAMHLRQKAWPQGVSTGDSIRSRQIGQSL